MGVLGAGGFVRVAVVSHIARTVGVADVVLAGGIRFFGDADGVRSHVGDETRRPVTLDGNALVQLLRQHHGLGRRKVQLNGSILLHGAGGIGSEGPLDGLVGYQFLYAVGSLVQIRQDLVRFFLAAQLDLFALVFRKSRRKGVLFLLGGAQAFLRQVRCDVPVFLGHEVLDLPFSVADDLQGCGLHAACGQAFADLVPQHRTDLIARDAVHDPSALLGVDEVHVDGTAVLDALQHGALRDLGEHDPVCLCGIDIQQTAEVPGDRFALPVGVCRQVDPGSFLRFLLDGLDKVRFAPHVDVFGFKVIFDVYAQAALGEVAQVTRAGNDVVAAAQKLPDGLRLGRRFHDDKIF